MNNIFKYILIGIIISICSLVCLKFQSNANALPVDGFGIATEEWSVINGQQTWYYDMGIAPEFSMIGLDYMYQSVNQKLYQDLGFDFNDVLQYGFAPFDIENWLNGKPAGEAQPGIDMWNTLTQGDANLQGKTIQQAIQEGYGLFRYAIPNVVDQLGNQAYGWIVGKGSQSLNTISNIVQNMYVPITEQFINELDTITDELVEEEEITNMSAIGVYRTPNMYAISTNGWGYGANFTTNNYFVVRDENDRLNLLSLYGHSPIDDWVRDSSYKINLTTGERIAFPTFRSGTNINFTVNNTRYTLTYIYDTNWSYITCQDYIPLYTDIVGDVDKNSYFYNYSDKTDSGVAIDIKSLIKELIGHYATTQDLKEIKDILEDIPVKPMFYPNPQPNGTPLAVPEKVPTDDQWESLNQKIDEILDNSILVDPFFPTLPDEGFNPNPNPDPDPDPNPNPNPDPSPNTGITVPEDFPTDPIFIPFTDILNAPFEILSIFKPIFALFGVNWLMPLWLLIPPIIIIVLIIRALM